MSVCVCIRALVPKANCLKDAITAAIPPLSPSNLTINVWKKWTGQRGHTHARTHTHTHAHTHTHLVTSPFPGEAFPASSIHSRPMHTSPHSNTHISTHTHTHTRTNTLQIHLDRCRDEGRLIYSPKRPS